MQQHQQQQADFCDNYSLSSIHTHEMISMHDDKTNIQTKQPIE